MDIYTCEQFVASKPGCILVAKEGSLAKPRSTAGERLLLPISGIDQGCEGDLLTSCTLLCSWWCYGAVWRDKLCCSRPCLPASPVMLCSAL